MFPRIFKVSESRREEDVLLRIVLGLAALVVADCSVSSSAPDGHGGGGGAGSGGTAGAPGNDAAFEQRSSDGVMDGAIHVAWVLENAASTPTDCISAQTSDIEVDITNASHIRVLSSTYYCVDMAETLEGFAPGDYSIQLSLFDNTNSVAAIATGTVTVMADGVANAGTLTLMLARP
jgi:hypothetical protein